MLRKDPPAPRFKLFERFKKFTREHPYLYLIYVTSITFCIVTFYNHPGKQAYGYDRARRRELKMKNLKE
jgi:hypothetical protein